MYPHTRINSGFGWKGITIICRLHAYKNKVSAYAYDISTARSIMSQFWVHMANEMTRSTTPSRVYTLTCTETDWSQNFLDSPRTRVIVIDQNQTAVVSIIPDSITYMLHRFAKSVLKPYLYRTENPSCLYFRVHLGVPNDVCTALLMCMFYIINKNIHTHRFCFVLFVCLL